MHAHQYEHEHHALAIIARYHHEADQARKLRQIRGERPHRIVEASIRLRATVGAILITVGQNLRQEPVASADQSARRDVMAEPGDSTVTV